MKMYWGHSGFVLGLGLAID